MTSELAMRVIFGVVSLLIVLAVIFNLQKKQLQAFGMGESAATRGGRRCAARIVACLGRAEPGFPCEEYRFARRTRRQMDFHAAAQTLGTAPGRRLFAHRRGAGRALHRLPKCLQ